MKARTSVVLLSFLVAQAGAQTVSFDFENAQAGSSLPLSLTVNGVTAVFSSTGLGGFYVQQPQNTISYTPPGFSGNCLNPTGIAAADLQIAFSQTLVDFAVLYSPQELGCDISATMRVTAYLDGALVGTATTNATANCPCTWPSEWLRFNAASGFNRVVVHYDARPACQDIGTIFLADNVTVSLAPPPIVLTNAVKLANGAFQFTFNNTPNAPFTVLGATNPTLPFSSWTMLSGLTEAPPGQFQFTDSQATNFPLRFYRVRSP